MTGFFLHFTTDPLSFLTADIMCADYHAIYEQNVFLSKYILLVHPACIVEMVVQKVNYCSLFWAAKSF